MKLFRELHHLAQKLMTPTWPLPRHRKKVLTKVKMTVNLTILTMQVCERVICQFCELLIFRTSSKMFKLQVVVTVQRDDVTNTTISRLYFIHFETNHNFPDLEKYLLNDNNFLKIMRYSGHNFIQYHTKF